MPRGRVCSALEIRVSRKALAEEVEDFGDVFLVDEAVDFGSLKSLRSDMVRTEIEKSLVLFGDGFIPSSDFAASG